MPLAQETTLARRHGDQWQRKDVFFVDHGNICAVELTGGKEILTSSLPDDDDAAGSN